MSFQYSQEYTALFRRNFWKGVSKAASPSLDTYPAMKEATYYMWQYKLVCLQAVGNIQPEGNVRSIFIPLFSGQEKFEKSSQD